MRHPTRSTPSFHVVITPATWAAISSVPAAVVTEVQARLHAIAKGVTNEDDRVRSPAWLFVGDYVVMYEIDYERCRVTLQEITRKGTLG